jgi:hypothetical protein
MCNLKQLIDNAKVMIQRDVFPLLKSHWDRDICKYCFVHDGMHPYLCATRVAERFIDQSPNPVSGVDESIKVKVQKLINLMCPQQKDKGVLQILQGHKWQSMVQVLCQMLRRQVSRPELFQELSNRLLGVRNGVVHISCYAGVLRPVLGVQTLVELLHGNTQLTVLDISKLGLTAEGCTVLAEALEENGTLTELHLGQSLLGTAGCHALSHCILNNSSIKVLDLSQTRAG